MGIEKLVNIENLKAAWTFLNTEVHKLLPSEEDLRRKMGTALAQNEKIGESQEILTIDALGSKIEHYLAEHTQKDFFIKGKVTILENFSAKVELFFNNESSWFKDTFTVSKILLSEEMQKKLFISPPLVIFYER